jgi:hypothetical protein
VGALFSGAWHAINIAQDAVEIISKDGVKTLESTGERELESVGNGGGHRAVVDTDETARNFRNNALSSAGLAAAAGGAVATCAGIMRK